MADNFSNFNRGVSIKVLGGTPEFYGLPQTDSHASAAVAQAKTALDQANADLTKANQALTNAKNAAATADAKVTDANNALSAAKQNLTKAQSALAQANQALSAAKAHKTTTADALTKANQAVADAQATVEASHRDHDQKLATFNQAKQNLANANAKVAAAKMELEDEQARATKLNNALAKAKNELKAAQDKLAADTKTANALAHANENLAKAKQALAAAKADVQAKTKANDEAQAALKTATANDEAAQAKAAKTAAALKQSTDRNNMLLAVERAQEAAAAKKDGYHADHGHVVDNAGRVVAGWTVNANGDLVDPDGAVIVKAEAKAPLKTSSVASAQPMSRMAMYHRHNASVAPSNSTANGNTEMPQTGTSANHGLILGMASLMMGLGLLGADRRRKHN